MLGTNVTSLGPVGASMTSADVSYVSLTRLQYQSDVSSSFATPYTVMGDGPSP